MPNWCEGDLKVRGTIANLKAFVQGGLEPVGRVGEPDEVLEIESKDGITLVVREINSDLWLKNTRRHFCSPDYIEVFAESPDDPAILIMPMQAAWCICAEELLALCQEFNVDMKIQGFEMGEGFSQIIEIVGGKIICDKEIEYDNWAWDCPCPRKGG